MFGNWSWHLAKWTCTPDPARTSLILPPCAWRHPPAASEWQAAALSQLFSSLKYPGKALKTASRYLQHTTKDQGICGKEMKEEQFLASFKVVANINSIRKWENFAWKRKTGEKQKESSLLNNKETSTCQLPCKWKRVNVRPWQASLRNL